MEEKIIEFAMIKEGVTFEELEKYGFVHDGEKIVKHCMDNWYNTMTIEIKPVRQIRIMTSRFPRLQY